MSSSCEGGRVLRVREIESVHVRPGGISLPGGKGGSEEGCVGWPAAPLVGYVVDDFIRVSG